MALPFVETDGSKPKEKVSRLGVYGVVFENQKILLVIQNQGVYCGKYDLPGGGMEFGETVEETLKREFKEELGATFSEMDLIDNLTTIHPVPETPLWKGYLFHRIGLIYRVDGVCFPESTDDMGCLNYVWLDIAELTQDNVTPLVWDAVLKLGALVE